LAFFNYYFSELKLCFDGKSFDDVFLCLFRLVLGAVPLDRNAVAADQKFSKVPLDAVKAQNPRAVFVGLQVFEKLAGIVTVDIGPLKKGAKKFRLPLGLQVVVQVFTR